VGIAARGSRPARTDVLPVRFETEAEEDTQRRGFITADGRFVRQ
jgi:hypothetical protein